MSLISNRIIRLPCRQMFLLSSRSASNFTMTQAQSQTLNKNFWNKNDELKRPLSPHLTIYKIQLTSTLSIFHRFTGIGVGAVLYAGGIGALFCANQNFPEILALIQENVPTLIITTSKTIIGGSVIYHTLNGIRHLIWDIGYGFQLKHLYLSGYIVLALTAVGTALVFIKA